jgi:hypothetical protein
VHGGRVRPEGAGLGKQPDRRAPVRGEARLILGGLLGHVDVQRPAGHDASQLGDRLLRHGTHRVDGRTDPRGAPVPRRLRAVGPQRHAAVGEPLLLRRERRADAAGQVARVEQRQPQAGG